MMPRPLVALFLLLGNSRGANAFDAAKPPQQHRPARHNRGAASASFSISSGVISRRGTFEFVALLPLLSDRRPAAATYENAPVGAEEESVNRVTTLPSGVTVQDLRPGTGDRVVEGRRVNVQWVLKRSNGYLVDSSSRNDGVPFIFTVGDPRGAIAGVDEGIRGMRVGGIRRIVVPPDLSYVLGVEDGKPGPIPAGFGPKQRIRRVMELLKDIPGEFIVVDVKVTRVQ